MYASTGDERLKEKGDAVVAGSGRVPGEARHRLPERLSRRSSSTASRRSSRSGRRTTRCTRSTPACSTCTSTATTRRPWTCARSSPTGSSPATAKLTDEQMQKMLGNEHGGMNEVLANLYGLTGEEKYLTIAQRFNHMAVLGPASQARRTSSPACTPTRRSPSSSAPPASTS